MISSEGKDATPPAKPAPPAGNSNVAKTVTPAGPAAGQAPLSDRRRLERVCPGPFVPLRVMQLSSKQQALLRVLTLPCNWQANGADAGSRQKPSVKPPPPQVSQCLSYLTRDLSSRGVRTP